MSNTFSSCSRNFLFEDVRPRNRHRRKFLVQFSLFEVVGSEFQVESCDDVTNLRFEAATVERALDHWHCLL